MSDPAGHEDARPTEAFIFCGTGIPCRFGYGYTLIIGGLGDEAMIDAVAGTLRPLTTP